MTYSEEMRTKYGFGDGESIPPDARAAREVYVRALNALAKKNESCVLAHAYDRPSVHNSCMILFAPRLEIMKQGLNLDDLWIPERVPERTATGPDEAMEKAIEEARGLELDRFVKTKVRVDRPRLRGS